METAEHREPCESRGSRTDLGAPGGEIPPGDSTAVEVKAEVPLTHANFRLRPLRTWTASRKRKQAVSAVLGKSAYLPRWVCSPQ
jgi:hypothetical protein